MATFLRPSTISRSPLSFLSKRGYPHSAAVKVPIALISSLRKRHPISMVKAKEALAKSDLNIEQALAWLEKDLEAGGAAKQAKLAGRVAAEGLIAVGVMGEGWGRRGGIVELDCETSFVYRTPGFTTLLQNLHHTSVFFHNPSTIHSHTHPHSHSSSSSSPSEPQLPVSHLVNLDLATILEAPLLSASPSADNPNSSLTAAQQITSLLTTTGENITLRRAAVFAPPTVEPHQGLFYPAFFAHSSSSGLPPNLGSPAAFLVLHLTGEGTKDPSKQLLKDTELLGRTLARQMVGVPCTSVYAFVGGDGLGREVVEGSEVLMEQHFMFYSGPEGEGGKSVGEVLHLWGLNRGVTVRVEGAERWVVGEGSEVEAQEA
ncbi:hypothetical protein BDY24DRAFT_403316 [Mrakia frigida]|uniref:uncharacterized protein n=1 Tax=Mrakia frigida TaxID=29902 RepID=UPI003FCBF929